MQLIAFATARVIRTVEKSDTAFHTSTSNVLHRTTNSEQWRL